MLKPVFLICLDALIDFRLKGEDLGIRIRNLKV